ncbi:hypothetical protein NPIL_435161, partial [Nephila pilipes]
CSVTAATVSSTTVNLFKKPQMCQVRQPPSDKRLPLANRPLLNQLPLPGRPSSNYMKFPMKPLSRATKETD